MAPPKDAAERKGLPLARGVLDYFPDALLEVARCSYIANEQHNPGEEMHWAKEKSTDEADALMRHLIERGTVDTDGIRHSAKVAWRALAMLQREMDAEAAAAEEGKFREDLPVDPPEWVDVDTGCHHRVLGCSGIDQPCEKCGWMCPVCFPTEAQRARVAELTTEPDAGRAEPAIDLRTLEERTDWEDGS